MPPKKGLDSFALLAWFLNEEPASWIDGLMDQAHAGDLVLLMSWMNAGEVYCMTARKKNPRRAEELVSYLSELPIRLVLPTQANFLAAARLKATRRISYADGFATALAIKHNAPIVTGDPEFRGLADVVSLEWIGA